MISCATVFMMWISKFENANYAWQMGHYGWFMRDESSPMNGWFSFEKDALNHDGNYINFHDNMVYKSGITNFFETNTRPRKFSEDEKILKQHTCILDGKVFYYTEWISDDNIKTCENKK